MQPAIPTSRQSQFPHSEELGLRSRLLELLRNQRLSQEQLAGKLHDDIGQYLTSISINAGLLAKRCQQARESALIAEISAAARMACISSRELSEQLRPHGAADPDGIESELLDLVNYYDIDGAKPSLTLVCGKTLNRLAPAPSGQICCLFEQLLLLFLPAHRPAEFVLSLTATENQANDSDLRLELVASVVAKGQALGEMPDAIETQQLLLRQSTSIHDLQLCPTPPGELHLQARIPAENGILQDRPISA